MTCLAVCAAIRPNSIDSIFFDNITDLGTGASQQPCSASFDGGSSRSSFDYRPARKVS
jgi:hypothetical protein